MPSLFWLAYSQTGAMFGAFSLLMFATHFIDIGLKGIIAQAGATWSDVVRPLVGHPIQLLANAVGLHFIVPDQLKDYIAVGLVFAFSAVRTVLTFNMDVRDEVPVSRRVGNRIEMSMERGGYLAPLSLLLLLVVVWPVFIVAMLLGAPFAGADYQTRLSVFLAPLVYLALLFAVNAWLA